MSFGQRINAEVIYYHAAEDFFRKAFMEMQEFTYDVNYGEVEELATISIPFTKDGLRFAILALINWACCLESSTNLCIRYIIQHKNYGEDLFQNRKRELKKLLNCNVKCRLDYINNAVGTIISADLMDDIRKLTQARNEFVHFDDEMKYCGGTLLLQNMQSLTKENLITYRRTLQQLLCIYRKHNLLVIDPMDKDAIIYGEGDLLFDEEPISRWRQLKFVLKHPVWYIFVRIPQKMRQGKYRRKIAQEFNALVNAK